MLVFNFSSPVSIDQHDDW